MQKRRTSRLAVAGTAGLLALASAAVAAPSASAGHGYDLRARLRPLNDSGVHGNVYATRSGKHVKLMDNVYGLAPQLPHAQHIHFGEQARHECPTFKDDKNRDFRINTVDGVPAYGPIAVSLTTKGDTSMASGLAVDRMPVADRNGNFHYERRNIKIHATQTDSAHEVARAISQGKGVVVVHGIDYNQNGMYDMKGAGASELDPKLPAEATDPAACGVLARAH